MADCIPYAIHVVTGKDLDLVKDLARQRDWDPDLGMNGIAGWYLLRDMGYQISQIKSADRITLKKFLPTLNPRKTYIISVTEHWFAVRNGVRFDKAKSNPRCEVGYYFEVEEPIIKDVRSKL